jgi:hypothetical protein
MNSLDHYWDAQVFDHLAGSQLFLLGKVSL